MQNLKKMILVTAVMMFAVLVTSCGDEKQQEVQFVEQQPQARTGFFQQGYQNNYAEANLYGYEGRQCSEFNNYQGFNSGPITGSRDFPTAGSLLQGNPEAPMRYNNGLCYRLGDVRDMYNQYSRAHKTPFYASPYAQFHPLYNQRSSGGSIDINHSESHKWHDNGGGAYDQGHYPFGRRRGDQFYLDFEYDGRNRQLRIEAERRNRRDPFDRLLDDFRDDLDY